MSKTILMIPGFWANESIWTFFCNFFDVNKYNCIPLTFPYHDTPPGEKPDPALGKMGVEDYIQYIVEEVEKQEEPPVLVGHSAGALYAQLAAMKVNISALVLLCSAAPSNILKFDFDVFKCFWGMIKRGILFSNKPGRFTWEEAHHAIFHNMPEEEGKELYERMVWESGKVIKQVGLNPVLGIGKELTELDEEKIKCPVLVLAGYKDRLTPMYIQRKLAEKLAAEYKEFPEHAHYILGEKGWEDVADYIVVWLNEVLR